MAKIGLVTGSFDPVTNGHLDIIARASKLFDTLYVGILYNQNKSGLFTIAERKQMIEEAVANFSNVKVVTAQDSLAVDVARELKKRGAKNIYMMSAYSLFTKGVDVFDKAYDEGLFTRLYTTNLSYVPKDVLKRKWIYQADCSEYVAKIIYTYYMGKSISPLLEYRSKILEDFARN